MHELGLPIQALGLALARPQEAGATRINRVHFAMLQGGHLSPESVRHRSAPSTTRHWRTESPSTWNAAWIIGSALRAEPRPRCGHPTTAPRATARDGGQARRQSWL